MSTVRNERGIALLIVLIVVALLTITVTEFTYSVQLDQHRTRNAMYAMQAGLLARSGINIMEGFLLQDGQDPNRKDVTWKGEDWWLGLDEFCKGIQLEESTLIRCSVKDESGKININKTYEPPRRVQGQTVSASAVVRDALRAIFERRGIDQNIVTQLEDYWNQEPPTGTDGQPLPIPEFESLEDFGAKFGLTAEQLISLRPVLTAMPTRRPTRPGEIGRINRVPTTNVNTAPSEVLAALLNPEEKGAPNEAVDKIMEKRAALEPIEKGDLDGFINGAKGGDPGSQAAKRQLLGVDSNFWRLEASVMTNVDPENPDRGGIGQTLSELVERRPAVATGNQQQRTGSFVQGGSGQSNQPLWTLRTLDWQKEGGARLFHETPPEDEESAGTENGETGTGPSRF